MSRLSAYAKWTALVVVLLLLAQFGSPFLFRNRRLRGYVLAHLEKSFGRHVEARNFSMTLLPYPQVEVDAVSIGEDPAFGQEYFLRADRLTAGVRWLGLLHGQFDFGAISLSRPSLILVRNEQGRWNLEGWLPPAPQNTPVSGVIYGPPRAESVNHLRKIEFDEGRINFKTGDEKRPFAFTSVSGSVEQVAPGRWQLRLEAQPWRSGVTLQSTGTLQVRGEVAGTSSRLQPAQIQVHWDKVSIADLFRMVTGNDSGVRGEFALDGTASVGKPAPGEAANPGVWKFSIHARSARIHRWDLIERGDNPALSLKLDGAWDVPAGEARAESAILDLPHSHFQGAASLQTAGMSDWNLRVNDAGIDAQDLLAWYRAFQPDVAEAVSAKQFFKARFAVQGRPLVWNDAELSSDGGAWTVPGFAKPVRTGPVHGNTSRNEFQVLPVRVFLDGVEKEAVAQPKPPKTKTVAEPSPPTQNQVEIRYARDLYTQNQSFSLAGRMSDVGDLFKAAAAFGKPLNAGWELTGAASGAFERSWNSSADIHKGFSHWTGTCSLTKAHLQAAGMNLPLQLDEIHASWADRGLTLNIAKAGALGAAWTGSIEQSSSAGNSAPLQWRFQLHADHLDAASLDLWFGPRARPNWLQRLLPSLLGKSDTTAKPSALLQRVSAEGDLTADSLTVEKVKLAHPRAHIAFRDLHLEVKDADAEWAGGTVRADMSAVFSGPPEYEISAEVDHASLSQFPWGAHWADRWNATASGKVHLTTSGVGREALLSQLAGTGELHLKSLELRGWDVPASLDALKVHTGSSRWDSATGVFTVKGRAVEFDDVQLENPPENASLSGELRFSQELHLTFTQESASSHKQKSAARPQFLLNGPFETPAASVHEMLGPEAAARE